MMNENVRYFDSVINGNNEENSKNVFNKFLMFKGNDKTCPPQYEKYCKKEASKKKEKEDTAKFIALSGGVITGAILLGKMSLSNLKQAYSNTETFANGFVDKTIDAINVISDKK